MTQASVATFTLTESGTTEEALNEKLEDLALQPLAPINVVPAAYNAGTTYAKGALVTELGQVYRSQVAGNIAHTPKTDADFEFWAPIATALVPLQSPSFTATPTTRTQPSYNKPPASSSATAPASETINPGDEAGLGQ